MPRKVVQSTVHSQQSTVKELFSCLLSAVLLILSFPNFNLEFLAWFGFVPLFSALRNKSKGKAFLISYFTGVIFWLGIIYWLIHVTLPGMFVLALYLALYFGIFGLIISTVDRGPWTVNLFFIPSTWVLLEFLRSHLLTGFPWALLGYSQYLNIPVIQIADITGVWGVSFLVMMGNVAIYSVVSCQLSVVRKIKKSLPFVLLVVIVLTYGYYKLNYPLSAIRYPLFKISVIQGNIPQEMKWESKAKDFIIGRYTTLTSQALKDKPDLIIWPEAALPVVLEEEPSYYESVKDFVKETKIPLLLGAVTLRDDRYYNSALLVSGNGELLGKYDKLHLVPFGEYIPLKKTLPFLETVVPIGDFTSGEEYTIFKIQNPKFKIQNKSQFPISKITNNFAVLICFEDLFPELSRNFRKKGADFLINITNDAWFKKTSSPYQHFSASVFRAVENRVFVVRAANTGVSGFIAPTGKIISLVGAKAGNNIFVSGHKSEEVPVTKEEPTFYTRFGDTFIIFCFLSILAGIIFRKKP